MTPWTPDQVEVVVFDVIGTLVDEDPTWSDAAARLAVAAGSTDATVLLDRWTTLVQQRMAAVVSGDSPWQGHGQLVAETAHSAVTETGGNATLDALAAVLDLEHRYGAWPDVATATAALRTQRLVAAVSNADPEALLRLANRNSISWDLALSTSAIRTYKPAPAAYRYAIDALRIDPGRALFVAAHPWDLRAAAQHGFRTAYVSRPGAQPPARADAFDVEVADLAELVSLLHGGTPS